MRYTFFFLALEVFILTDTAPCGQIYINLDESDLQNYASSDYVIKPEQVTRRTPLRNATAYLYVVTVSGELILGDVIKATLDKISLHHPALVKGQPAAYAGEIVFYNQQAIRWNNRSGHYRPNPGQNREESNCIKALLETILRSSLPEQSWVW